MQTHCQITHHHFLAVLGRSGARCRGAARAHCFADNRLPQHAVFRNVIRMLNMIAAKPISNQGAIQRVLNTCSLIWQISYRPRLPWWAVGVVWDWLCPRCRWDNILLVDRMWCGRSYCKVCLKWTRNSFYTLA